MILVNKLTSNAAQTMKLLTETGEQITFALRYRPAIQCWTFDLAWGVYNINGMRLVNAINIIRQWRDIFPFGLMVKSTDILEPQYIDDFTSGRIKIYILSQSEVLQLETGVFE